MRTAIAPITRPAMVAVSKRQRNCKRVGELQTVGGNRVRHRDRDRVAGDAGDHHLGERDEAAIVGEKGQRQRDDAVDHRAPEDVGRPERRKDERQQREPDDRGDRHRGLPRAALGGR